MSELFRRMEFGLEELQQLLNWCRESSESNGQSLLKHLLERQEKFRELFRTGKGSYYFVLPGGESLRLKSIAEREDLKLERQPILQHIYYVGDVSQVRVFPDEERPELFELHPEEIAVGLTPLEIGVVGRKFGLVTEEPIADGLVRIQIAAGEADRLGFEPALPYHKGHVITDIIKRG